MAKRKLKPLFVFKVVNPKTEKTFRAAGSTFREVEPYVRREFEINHPKHVDVVRLSVAVQPSHSKASCFARRYFRDMSYKSF